MAAQDDMIELSIGQPIQSLDREGGASGRIGLFVEQEGVVYLVSSAPILGNFAPVAALTADGRRPLGRSRWLPVTEIEGDEDAGADWRAVSECADLVSVTPLEEAVGVADLGGEHGIADPGYGLGEESIDCAVTLLRTDGDRSYGRVRNARAFARLEVPDAREPRVYSNLLEVEPTKESQFGRKGDSGALVIFSKGRELLGIFLGVIDGRVGLVAPLSDFLLRERFRVFPHRRVRARRNEALFSVELDAVLHATKQRPEQAVELLTRARPALEHYLNGIQRYDVPGAVASERDRFIEATIDRLDEPGLKTLVGAITEGRAGQLKWFLEALVSNERLATWEDKMHEGRIPGKIRGVSFEIAADLWTGQGQADLSLSGRLDRDAGNSPDDLVEAFGSMRSTT